MVILNLLIARLFSFLWFVIRRGLFHGFLQFVFEVYSLIFGGHLLPVHKSEHGVQIGIRRLMRLFGCLLSKWFLKMCLRRHALFNTMSCRRVQSLSVRFFFAFHRTPEGLRLEGALTDALSVLDFILIHVVIFYLYFQMKGHFYLIFDQLLRLIVDPRLESRQLLLVMYVLLFIPILKQFAILFFLSC